MDLPIDVVPGTDPPRFRWKQAISTPVGDHVAHNEGPLPPPVERAVAALIALAKSLARRVEELRHANADLIDRVDAQQTELLQLGKKSESPAPLGSPSRKGKG